MKKIFLIVLLLIGLFALYKASPVQKIINTPGESANEVEKITVQQKIMGQSDFSTHQIEKNKTALDLLKQTTSSAVTVGENENAYVVGINGIKAEEEKKEFWSFYVNGKLAPVGAGSYILQEGDKIEWKKENY